MVNYVKQAKIQNYYEGVATVKFWLKRDENRNINVILTDVLYVLELKENLLSTTMLMLKGLKIVQENDTITAYSKQGGTIIAVTV